MWSSDYVSIDSKATFANWCCQENISHSFSFNYPVE